MKTISFKTVITVAVIIMQSWFANAQGNYGEIRGIIKNSDHEPVPFATVKVLQGNMLIGGAQTDADGNYHYKPLTPGTYEIVVMEATYKIQTINKIVVSPNEVTYVDVKLSENMLGTVEVVAEAIEYTPKGVKKNMYSMQNLNAEELTQNAGITRGDIKTALAAVSSEVITDQNGDLHFRGGRGEASGFFVDGVRTLGLTTVPGLAVENLTFFSGGVPAMYGDLTSGAVMITTKSYFSGIREKNIRNQAFQEKERAKKAAEKEKQEEEKRKNEIEREKSKEGQ